MNPINIPKMNNNCLIIDRSINFNIFDKKIKKVPKVKQLILKKEQKKYKENTMNIKINIQIEKVSLHL